MALPTPAESMRQYFACLAAGGRRELSFEKVKPQDVTRWQQELRAALTDLLSLEVPDPQPVYAEILSEDRPEEGYRRQLLRLQGRDGTIIPAYWLIPDNLQAPAGVVLALHGHGPGKVIPAAVSQDYWGEPVQITGERDFALQAVRRGYLALAPDLRGFGEMMLPEALDRRQGSACTEMAMRGMMVSQPLMGMRVRDLRSCVDWLLEQEAVDERRLFCTGQSGGGTATVWAAAMDERLAAAIPSCGFCTFEHSIMSIGHCPCNYVPGVMDLCEYYDLAGLIAPRPLLIVTGALDSIFPLEGVRLAYERAQEIYRAAGAEDKLELYVGPEGHRYYAARVWPFLEQKLG